MKNIVDATPKALQEEIHSRVRGIFEAANLETARFLLNQTLDEYDVKDPHAMEVLENGFDDATAVLELPKRYRTKLRTTNSLERVNEEIRQRERVIRIFPNRNRVFVLSELFF
jgi:transposase-like protein